ncbi:hypothetical protein D9M70_501000 [compost metagenome]
MSATLQLAPEDMEQIEEARAARAEWLQADLESPECAKAFARWERLKLKLALLLINRTEGAQ